MRHLTKEWYRAFEQFRLKFSLRTDKRAQIADETFTKRVYDKKLKEFLKSEISSGDYRNHREILNEINARIQRLTDKRQIKKLTEYRNTYAKLHKKEILSGEFTPFDKNAAITVFNADLERKLNLARSLPQEILDKIADLRLFALGYTTQEVKDMVKEFSDEKGKIANSTLSLAHKESAPAEKMLKADNPETQYLLEFNENMGDTIITAIRQNNEDLYIYIDFSVAFIIENAIISEQENTVGACDFNKQYCDLTLLKEYELYFENGKYELHCLMLNEYENGKTELWYFTVSGTRIRAY